MRFVFIAVLAGFIGLGATDRAEAIGCLSGAVLGGVAGHLASHGILGAVGGCVAGHEWHKHQQRQDAIRQQQYNNNPYYNSNQNYRR